MNNTYLMFLSKRNNMHGHTIRTFRIVNAENIEDAINDVASYYKKHKQGIYTFMVYESRGIAYTACPEIKKEDLCIATDVGIADIGRETIGASYYNFPEYIGKKDEVPSKHSYTIWYEKVLEIKINFNIF
jgi:hypothetical protein